jgi:hypothetical protein
MSATSTPAGLADSPQHTPPDSTLLSEITRDGGMLHPLASCVLDWLYGRCCQVAQMSPQAQQPHMSARGAGREQASCIAFAAAFKPSLHLVSVLVSFTPVEAKTGCWL